MFRLINGIIEFDQKLTLIPTFLLIRQSVPSTKRYKIFVFLLIYWIGHRVFCLYLWPPKDLNITIILCYILSTPLVMDIVIVMTTWFFLENLEWRFETLNDIWICLSTGLIAIPGEWSYSEIAMLMENTRLLHADLSELLKIFSLGYGPLLLSFFVFNFINILFYFFVMIKIKFTLPVVNLTENILRQFHPYLVNVHCAICTMTIIVVASRINNKVTIGRYHSCKEQVGCRDDNMVSRIVMILARFAFN